MTRKTVIIIGAIILIAALISSLVWTVANQPYFINGGVYARQ